MAAAARTSLNQRNKKTNIMANETLTNFSRGARIVRSGRICLAAACAAVLLAGCKTEVYQGLTEPQANAMMAVLLKNGIPSEKISEKNGYTLSVESDHVAATLELMRENNLPRPAYETMGDVFSAKGMISSATEEEARMTYALGQELSETFSQIDGVLTARVHVVLAKVDHGSGKTTPASAAVFLRHTPDSLAPNLVARIQELTSNAVPGLDKANVSVMLVPVRDTVTVPMPEADDPTTKNLWILGTSAVLFLMSMFAAVFAWRTRKDLEGMERASPAEKTTGGFR